MSAAVGDRLRAGSRLKKAIPGLLFVGIIAFVAAVILIQLEGFSALPTISLGLEYALGSGTAIARTLAWGLPLVVVSLGVSLAFRSGIFNLGAEGQVFAGAMAAAIVGAYIGPMFTIAHLFLATLAAAVVGGLIAGGLGWLRARWRVDEVVSTLLSNYIIILFCTYLVTGPLRDPTRQSGTTRRVYDSAMFTEIMPKTGLNWSVVPILVIVIAVWWLSEKSVSGYRWRMTGDSQGFAASVGIDTAQSQIRAMFASGALAAIAGSFLVTASQGRYWTEIGGGLGWDAVLIALVARARPIATVVWVVIYSVMRSTARGIEQVSEVPAELSSVLISLIIIAVAAQSGFFTRVSEVVRAFRSRGEA